MLQEAISRRNDVSIDIAAILNDTTGQKVYLFIGFGGTQNLPNIPVTPSKGPSFYAPEGPNFRAEVS